ncbi:carnitine O-palmitoyltransferase 2, mitochondrial [Acetobacter orientalis]|uniref:Carnitine O-palmitoyltransferase 2, mitochondrial n=1 Tax=Acetobacter orientalis TaxID=146474 RepID=A0A2Z5ZEA9_9PROT|nr:carnitine O-palmitoyltransferase 2, mitochondrial [Acetobacter orientalis]
MTKMTEQRIADNLQMLETEIRYLRVIVSVLLNDCSPEAYKKAQEFIKFVEQEEPRITTDLPHKEAASAHSTEIAAYWASISNKRTHSA